MFKLTLCSGDVLGDINENRALSAVVCDKESAADGLSQLTNVLYDKVVLGNGHGDACDIHLLEGVKTQQACADISCDSHHRNAVHVCGCDSGNKVCCARA